MSSILVHEKILRDLLPTICGNCKIYYCLVEKEYSGIPIRSNAIKPKVKEDCIVFQLNLLRVSECLT